LRQAPSFGTFLPNAIAFKSMKNYLRKSCSALALKMLVKLTQYLHVLEAHASTAHPQFLANCHSAE
jgi:hypothetical protein